MTTLLKRREPTHGERPARPHIAHWIRLLALPIIIGWLALAFITNSAVPQVEVIGQEQSVPMAAEDAPSTIAMNRIGKVFQEYNSNTSVMVLLESDQPLGNEAHQYYDQIVAKLKADTRHVEHIQDFWSDPLTAAGSQSADGKAAYVQVYLAGNMGEALANESVAAAQKIVESVPKPPGLTVFVTGPSALMADTHIAGAMVCLNFTRSPMFKSLGIPVAVGMVVVVAAALTLGPAVVTAAAKIGALEPKRAMRVRFWRRVGAVVVRWPGPILIGTIALSLVGLLALPGYHTDYNDRHFLPGDIPANEGYAAADRHFPGSRLNPELLMIESDHDLRNSSDFLVIERVAKQIFHQPGIGRVQTITRPLGTPIEHSSIPFMLGMQGNLQTMNMSYLQDRMKDMLKMGDDMDINIDSMTKMYNMMGALNAVTHDMVGKMDITYADITNLRDHIADFDDFFRPIRNYLYWEPHCFDIPMCQATRSIFDTIDGIDAMTDDFQTLLPSLHQLDVLTAEMRTLMPPMIDTMRSMKNMQLTMQSTQAGMYDQIQSMQENQSALGKAFDDAKNDDSFYLPPEVFDNADFKRGMKMFLSPDGKAVRFIISHEGDPMSKEGLTHVDTIRNAAFEAIKGTPLEGSKLYLAGTSTSYKDMQDSANYDLMIAGIAALCLIFIIMLILTRAVVAAAVIVGTVALSLGTSFGLSVLIWQDILGQPLHFFVLAMSVIILLAVGSDYNLLLVSRFKEEIHAGLNTGIIRSMGGTGSVVTSAGLVFAMTMATMVFGDLKVLAQVGSTIAMGLLFDTLVIRSFMTPSIAALLGRWFWWPQVVRQRPAPVPWPGEKASDQVDDERTLVVT